MTWKSTGIIFSLNMLNIVYKYLQITHLLP